jgi:hypothetical protein
MTRSMRIPIYSAIAVVLAAGGLWWYLGAPGAPESSVHLTFAEQVAQGREANAAALSPEASQQAEVVAAASFKNVFNASQLGFTFGYPDQLKAGSFTDPATGAVTITVQDVSTHVGFQVYARPWQGSDTITEAMVEQDLPEIGAHDFSPVSLAGVPGVAFGASDPAFGDSLQVWFARGGYLYQVSTYRTQGPLLSKVLGTWKWTK